MTIETQVGDMIDTRDGAMAQVVKLCVSGRLDVEIIKAAGGYKVGDRLIWLDPNKPDDFEYLDYPAALWPENRHAHLS